MGKCVHWNEIDQPLEGHVYLPQHRRVRSKPVKSVLKLSPEPSSSIARARRPSYEIYAPSDAVPSQPRQIEPFATLKPSPPPFHPQPSPPVAKAPQSIYAKPAPSCPRRISIHSSLRIGASKPLSLSSKHHEQELACHPPLKCIYLLVEICHGRFNIEVQPPSGSPVTVGDIISRITTVLRGKLGMGLEECSCGARVETDRTISQFAGVSLRSQDGDQSKWKVHLNHSWASVR